MQVIEDGGVSILPVDLKGMTKKEHVIKLINDFIASENYVCSVYNMQLDKFSSVYISFTNRLIEGNKVIFCIDRVAHDFSKELYVDRVNNNLLKKLCFDESTAPYFPSNHNKTSKPNMTDIFNIYLYDVSVAWVNFNIFRCVMFIEVNFVTVSVDIFVFDDCVKCMYRNYDTNCDIPINYSHEDLQDVKDIIMGVLASPNPVTSDEMRYLIAYICGFKEFAAIRKNNIKPALKSES